MLLPFTLLLLSLSFVNAKPCCSLVPPKSKSTGLQTSSSGSGAAPGEAVTAAAYYPGWESNLTPANVSWAKYNQMIFAFATTTSDAPYYDLLGQDSNLMSFVQTAHANNVNATLSVGGWTGSGFFSQILSNPTSLSTFVTSLVNLTETYQLDGLDFDWEYPNNVGAGCNTNSPDDTTNFLTFLTQLRSQVGNKITLSAPVGLNPWLGPSGQQLQDVSGFAGVLDWIMIMDYDVWGSWSPTVGPNAPLNDTCAPTSDQQGSAVSAVKSWTSAGMPPSQIVLGLAAYGHSFHVNSTAAFGSNGDGVLVPYPVFDAALQPFGPDDTPSTTLAGRDTPSSTSTSTASTSTPTGCGGGGAAGPSGIFNFNQLITSGFLTASGTPADGISYRYDNCSQTAYVYNPTTEVMISFDDAKAWAAKGQFMNQEGLKGYAVWDVTGDMESANAGQAGLLTASIWEAMGIQKAC